MAIHVYPILVSARKNPGTMGPCVDVTLFHSMAITTIVHYPRVLLLITIVTLYSESYKGYSNPADYRQYYRRGYLFHIHVSIVYQACKVPYVRGSYHVSVPRTR